MLDKFEKYSDSTLSKNISKYNTFLNSRKRSDIVAWGVPGSQRLNFKLVDNYIPYNSSLLDFGCGIGDFSKYIEYKELTGYKGVDINPSFIEIAKKSYPDKSFELITGVDSIVDNYDVICAIGVFTWYITKIDFINTIRKLYEKSNKCLVVTFLNSKTEITDKNYWVSNYRYYTSDLLKELFPDLNIKTKVSGTYLVMIIEK